MTAHTSKCQAIQDQIEDLSQYQIRQAEPTDPVFLHIQSCPDCRIYWEQAQALDQALDHWQVPAPQHNINANVMGEIAQLEHRKAQQHTLRRTLLIALKKRLPISLAALLLLLLSLAGSLGFNLWQHQRLVDTERQRVLTQQKSAHPTEQVVHVAISPTPTIPKHQIMPARHTAPSQSFFISPQHTPSALVIVLGAPPMITTAPESLMESVFDNNPL